MKTILFIISFSISLNIASKDSLFYFVNPTEIDSGTSIENIYITIVNNYNDTIVTTLDFFAQFGVNDSSIYFPISFYSPNMLTFKSKSNDYFLLDAIIDVHYYYVPKLLTIPPNSIKVIIIKLDTIRKNLINYEWLVTGYMKFAKKIELDKFFQSIYKSRINEYSNSLYNDLFIYSDVFKFNQIDSFYLNNNLDMLIRFTDYFKY